MMRIQTHRSEDCVIIEIEGELAGAYVSELEQFWRGLGHGAPADKPPAAIVVDVSDVFTIDRCGRRLLQSMHSSGVKFIGARLAIQDVLDEIAEQKEAKNV